MSRKFFQEALKVSIKSGYIGIGISVSFSIIFDGLYNSYDLWIWIVMIGFGFMVGFLIAFSNNLVSYLLLKTVPDFLENFFIQILTGFLISTMVFYGIGFLFLVKYFHFMLSNYLLYISLGTGVISMMIHMFFIYTNEQEEKLYLEQENRELAVVEERNRIARELHDSVSQNLFGISLNLNTLTYILEDDRDKGEEMIIELQKMVQEIQTEMRLMIYELRPVALQEKGFFEAIENLASLFRNRYSLDISCQVTGDEDGLGSKSQLVIYRVLQESLNNIVKHSKANRVRVGLKIKDQTAEMTVRDNGKGFNPEEVIDKDNHFGIKGMKERIERNGGTIKIDSVSGDGTVIFTKVVCDNLNEGV